MTHGAFSRLRQVVPWVRHEEPETTVRSMPTTNLLKVLQSRPVVYDGAMGTRLYESGYFINNAFDEANLSKPDLVRSCHGEYADAGAEILQSNTFSANRFLLGRYGADEQTVAINQAGIRLAREAAGSDQWVSGSVGPTGEGLARIGPTMGEKIEAAFVEQIEAQLTEGVDLITLETFHHKGEMKIALDVARRLYAGPIVAQMSFGEDGRLRDGTLPSEVAAFLKDSGADVVGVNCDQGPALVFDAACAMLSAGLPVSAQPNAGVPRRLDQRLIYMATPEYFGVYARRFFKAGIRLVGGCCGTGPEHIKAIANACRMFGGGAPEATLVAAAARKSEIKNALPLQPLESKSLLGAKLARVWHERFDPEGPKKQLEGPDDFVVSVEVNPHPGLTTDKAEKGVRLLKAAGVDVFNIADGPRAVVRMSNWAMGMKVAPAAQLEPMLHICCRDRNILGLQSDLLGLHVMGARNLVVITGDPPKMGDYPKATAVFDLDSVELLKMINWLNQGIDPSGRAFGEQTNFLCACGAEPGALDYDREIDRLAAKVRAGADYVMTQPVYDPAVLERFLNDVAELQVPVLVGLLPLASHRNAEFLHNEVPGMQVPEATRERMKAAGSGVDAQAEGVAIAQEMLEAVKHRVVGAYVIPPFSRYQTAIDVLKVVGYGNREND